MVSPSSPLWNVRPQIRNSKYSNQNPKSQAPNLKVSGIGCQVSGKRNIEAETFFYLLQQMTAKRSDLMTPQAYD
jgi:hypothetical protein